MMEQQKSISGENEDMKTEAGRGEGNT